MKNYISKNKYNYREVVDVVLSGNVVKAVKFFSPKEIIRATKTRYGGKISNRDLEITLSFCKPNFAEREWLKNCTNKNTKFPMEGVQMIKLYNPKKKSVKRKKASSLNK